MLGVGQRGAATQRVRSGETPSVRTNHQFACPSWGRAAMTANSFASGESAARPRQRDVQPHEDLERSESTGA
jgi:hypothetical protein